MRTSDTTYEDRSPNPYHLRNPAIRQEMAERVTPYGKRYVTAFSSDEVWVSDKPVKLFPVPLSMQGSEPRSDVLAFKVVRIEDGAREVTARETPGQAEPFSDVEIECAAGLATAYANDHADYMDGLKPLLREERILELEIRAAKVWNSYEASTVQRWERTMEESLAELPEEWQATLRATEPTVAAFKAAPAPLGPLMSKETRDTPVEGQAYQVARMLLTLHHYVARLDLQRDGHLKEAAELREEAQREMEELALVPFKP